MNRQLRVLQLIDSLSPAGAERSLTALAPHLVNAGIDLHVGYYAERDGLRPELERAGIRVTSLDVGDGRQARVRRTIRLLQEATPDVVHTTLFEADLAGRRAAARMHIPCVSSLVNTAYGPEEIGADGLSRLKVRAAQAADALTARQVTRFHALTQHVATVMGRRLRIPSDRIDVIPRGRDPQTLGRRTPERRAATRRRLGIPLDAPLIVAVGRQEPQKGLDVLLCALASVRDSLPDVRVLVAGREGRATAALNRLARGAASQEMVTFLGARNDVPDLLAAADVFAFPSRWEGFGGTILEAMALECPIVSSDLTALRETIDESTALLVPAGDPRALARGVTAALRARTEAQSRARAARQRFEDEFTIGTSALRMSRLYAAAASQ